MIKQELYNMLSSLEALASKEEKGVEYWQSLSYLMYCNNYILHNEDETFTQRLLDLIEISGMSAAQNNSCPSCCDGDNRDWPFPGFLQYAIDPFPLEDRSIRTELFPRAFLKTFSL